MLRWCVQRPELSACGGQLPSRLLRLWGECILAPHAGRRSHAREGCRHGQVSEEWVVRVLLNLSPSYNRAYVGLETFPPKPVVAGRDQRSDRHSGERGERTQLQLQGFHRLHRHQEPSLVLCLLCFLILTSCFLQPSGSSQHRGKAEPKVCLQLLFYTH